MKVRDFISALKSLRVWKKLAVAGLVDVIRK